MLGYPVETTLSPAIHNVAFRQLGLDWTYLRWSVRPDALGDAVRGLRALGAAGANVTMPHKERIVDHLDEITGEASIIGAVNTVQVLGERLLGHNTDAGGFGEFLVGDAGFTPDGSAALVLGAGGAARAVVRSLASLGAGRVVVAARRRDAAQAVAALAGDRGAGSAWRDAARHVADAALVVNATPLGAAGERVLEDAELTPEHCVVDLVYSPPSTPLLELARARGASAWGGLGMLVRQAAASFEIWTGRKAPVETMSAAAVRAIGHHG